VSPAHTASLKGKFACLVCSSLIRWCAMVHLLLQYQVYNLRPVMLHP
jgi:hypothetical protein